MKKILITDSVDKKCVDVLTSAGFEVNYKPGMKPDQIVKVIGLYHGLVVRSDTKVTADLIQDMDQMEVIGRAGSGVDNIDTEAATRKGIIVLNTPGGNTISTAEHTMSLMLSMCRNIPQADSSIKSGKWERKKFQGTEVFGKTLGVIGLGKIGREVALRAQGFGMSIVGFDPVFSEIAAEKMNIELVTLNNLFERSDIITVHVPYNEDTHHLISEETLSLCKDGVKIINCARGGIIDEVAILKALESGKVSAAAFDVYEQEPPDFSGGLIQHPKVVTTPHLGASTEEAQEKVAVQIAEEIVDLFKNKIVRGAVNASAIEAIGNKELAPYVKLAENMGTLQSQLTKEKIKKISIQYSGELLNSSNGLLVSAFLKGFLSKLIPDSVNLVNSALLAKEMGLIVDEKISGEVTDYKNLFTVILNSDKNSYSLSGTVFGSNDIRVVSINNFRIEIKPEGNLLFYSNIDKPGVLATVGKVLADNQINIAGLSLGRKGIGEEAITVINVDSVIDKNTISKISSISGVNNIYAVKI
jgi:D-3-phosphoglycerate dehydrogenase